MRRRGRWRQLWDGARLRCPVCRDGPIFASGWRMNEQCPRCHAPFESDEGDWTGAVQLAQLVMGVLGFLGFTILLLARVPLTWAIAYLALVVVVLPILFYRNIKGLWVGFYHAGKDF